ncbi:MAG: hypothetical protein QW401_02385 [Thermoplasmata archaeon]
MNVKMRILSGSYDRSDEKNVVIELFGKSDNGKSVTLRYKNFKPYFYLVEPPADLIELWKKDPEIISMDDYDLWVNGKIK